MLPLIPQHLIVPGENCLFCVLPQDLGCVDASVLGPLKGCGLGARVRGYLYVSTKWSVLLVWWLSAGCWKRPVLPPSPSACNVLFFSISACFGVGHTHFPLIFTHMLASLPLYTPTNIHTQTNRSAPMAKFTLWHIIV